MNIIVIIVAVIVGLIALLFIVALFTKKEYIIKREIIINRPKKQVFDYVKILQNQENYNKWWMMDPNAKRDYTGTDGKEGFTAFWNSDSNKVGQGEQEIKKVTEGERIDYEIRFLRPFKSIAQTYIVTETVANDDTWVMWAFSGVYKYPSNILLLMDMDKLLGGDIHVSLIQLKNAIEKYPVIKPK